MANKKMNPIMEFLVAALRSNPNVTYKDVAAAAKKKRMTIYPITYGRAKLLLGMVKAKRRTSKRAPTNGRMRRAARGPGRPRAAAGDLASLVAMIRERDQERLRLRAALDQISKVLAGVL